MLFLALGLLLVLLLFGPQAWARWILARHSRQREDIPGTGGELARHLLDQLNLHEVVVEVTEQGDHYDPIAKAVRLTPANLNGKSLTAVAVAAHEVGHAIQDYSGYGPLHWRGRLVGVARQAERFGAGVMMVMPIVAAITRSPVAGGAVFVAGGLGMGGLVIVHLITLPVEFDASYGRALPLLKAGRYVNEKDEKAVRSILRACAMTYAAASLAGLLSFWRWFRLLRR